jgi:hypothetical protein
MTSHWRSRKRKTATKLTFLSVVDSGSLHVFRVRAATLSVCNPDRDQDGKTPRAGCGSSKCSLRVQRNWDRKRDHRDRRNPLHHGKHHGSSSRSCARRDRALASRPFHRVAVVLGGDVLLIEYRDGGESLRGEISSGQVDWEEPTDRVHRAVNVGGQSYEPITVFLLDRPDAARCWSAICRSS